MRSAPSERGVAYRSRCRETRRKVGGPRRFGVRVGAGTMKGVALELLRSGSEGKRPERTQRVAQRASGEGS